mgnify:CR=1 FL=1
MGILKIGSNIQNKAVTVIELLEESGCLFCKFVRVLLPHVACNKSKP